MSFPSQKVYPLKRNCSPVRKDYDSLIFGNGDLVIPNYQEEVISNFGPESWFDNRGDTLMEFWASSEKSLGIQRLEIYQVKDSKIVEV